MAAGDLCSYDDVIQYVPGYTSVDETDTTLVNLIAAESDLFQTDARREIVPTSAEAATRRFTVTELMARMRRVRIGDLSTDEDVTVTLLKSDGTTDQDVTDQHVPLYDGDRTPTNPWQPITDLAFPRALTDAPDLCTGKVLEVTGIWGFPAVPAFVRQGVAARVILRYVTDAAGQGTALADAIANSNINFGALFERSEDALQAVQRKPWP